MRKFNIVTLSANQRLADPVSVITGGVALLTSLFPNIFGGGRKRLSNEDWLTLIPGAGYWTTQLREYLKTRIHYDVDFTTNVQPFTVQFVADNNAVICPKTYTFQNPPGNNPGGGGTSGWTPCLTAFYSILNKEKSTGGNSPVGITPGGYGLTTDWSSLIPLAIGGLVLVALMKSPKRGKK